MKKGFLFVLIFAAVLIASPKGSALYYVNGTINDSLNGEPADTYNITLWNPLNGIGDNLTDTIGTTGASGLINEYLIDCHLLSVPCQTWDNMSLKVFNNGTNYVTETITVQITGASYYDLAPTTKLNSPPEVAPIYTLDYGNASLNANLTCSATDIDSNLKNITLFGNWSGIGNGWHVNETKTASGNSSNATFVKNISEGTYIWGCLATDELSISNFSATNYTITIDLTPPQISELVMNISYGCGTSEYVRVNCTVTDELVEVDKVIIESIMPTGGTENTTAAILLDDVYYADILLDEIGGWRFNCIANDSVGNVDNLSSGIFRDNPDEADLTLSSEDINFSIEDPIENATVIINATIHNLGCTDANNFLVGFYNGDPATTGKQINGNQTISVAEATNGSANVSWFAEIGYNNIFVVVDVADSISEFSEVNNTANKSIDVGAWQEFYGNTSVDKLIGIGSGYNISLWYNETSLQGNIFIIDSESAVNWNSLQSIGKDVFGDPTANDFADIDALLGMSGFQDSVSDTFTTDGNTPFDTANFTIHQKIINNTPIVNTTNTTNFITGILWDISDDISNNDEYDQADKEDLIFIAKINKGKAGFYGNYDYEIKIPARLRDYDITDTSIVYLYYDLN